MAGNAIGQGALILTANADRMLSTLDKAGKQAQEKANKISDSMNKGGGVGAFLGGAAFGAGWGLVMQYAGKAATSLIEMVNHAQEFRTEMERAAVMTAEVAKVQDRMTKSFDERLGAIANPGDKLAEVEAQVKRFEAERAGKLAQYNTTMAENEKLRRNFGEGATDSWKLFLGGGLDRSLAEVGQRINEAAVAATKFGDRLSDLRQQAARLRDPANDPAVIGSVNQLTESLRIQADTFGLTGAQAEIAKLKIRGATDGMLADAQKQADRLQALEDAKKETKLSGAMTKGSTDAYSLVAKFQATNAVAEGVAKKQEAEQKEANRLLKQLVNLVAGAQIVQEG